MAAADLARQAPNGFRMKLLGAEGVPGTAGAAKLKDAMNEALRDWVANVEDTFYIIGTAAGPHHYPLISLDNHWSLAQFGAGHSCLENVIVRPAPRASGRRRSRRDSC